MMSDTVVAVIVTGLVTLLASFGGQALAHKFARTQAVAGRREDLRIAMREVVIEYVAAGMTLSHGMALLLTSSLAGLDTARASMTEIGDAFSGATRRFSDAEARIRLSVADAALLGPCDAVSDLYRDLTKMTSEPATTELLNSGRASAATVGSGLAYLRQFDVVLARFVDAAVPALADELEPRKP